MYSSSDLCCATALRMILSSTSVMFMTWSSWKPLARSQRAQQVDESEGAEIADVGEVVDRGPAGVHADGVVARRRELFHLLGQRVVEAQRHKYRGIFIVPPAEPHASGTWWCVALTCHVVQPRKKCTRPLLNST